MQLAAGNNLLDRIQALWREELELGAGQVQPDSHFLLLGGDSLQLARLLERVHGEFGVSLPLHELARYATPARMAACCSPAHPCADLIRTTDALEARNVSDVPAKVDSAGVPDTVARRVAGDLPAAWNGIPATPVQQGIWLAAQLAAPQPLYWASVLVHLSGALDLAALQQAWALLFRFHPLLHARLCHDGRTRRLHMSFTESAVAPELTVQSCSAAWFSLQLQVLLDQPLGPGPGPLCQLHLFSLSLQQHVLLLRCHHTITDGWSGGIMLQHLATCYSRAVRQQAPLQQSAELHFLAYCQRVHARGLTARPEHLSWWREQLTAVDQVQHWLLQSVAAEPWPHVIQPLELTVSEVLVDALHQRAKALQQTLFILFLHAVKAGLHDYSGEPCQPLLVPIAQRRMDETGSIGCFIETLLLPGAFQPALPLAAALNHEAATFAAAQRHHLPLTLLAAQLRPRLLPDGNAWSSILFAYQNFPRAAWCWEGLRCRVESVSEHASQYALKLEILPGSGAWILRIEHASAVLDNAAAAALGQAILGRLQLAAEG